MEPALGKYKSPARREFKNYGLRIPDSLMILTIIDDDREHSPFLNIIGTVNSFITIPSFFKKFA
jgi:hypothetical protein